MRLFLLLLFLLLLPLMPVHGGVCKGSADCKACENCRKCKYCNSGKGSCNVKREAEDRAYAERQKKREESGK